MIKKNEELVVKVSELSSEGKGVSKLDDGFVVFSDGTLPGDEALIQIRKKKPNYAEAKLIEVIKNSEFRIDPVCRYFGVCGGCKIQNYDYLKQLEFKTTVVRDAIERIGKFNGLIIPVALKSDDIFYYRNKMEFSFSDDEWVKIPPGQELIPPPPPFQRGNSNALEKDQEFIPPNPPFQGGNINASEENQNLIPPDPPYKGGQGGWKDFEKDQDLNTSLQVGDSKKGQERWEFDRNWLKERGLILGGYHLPYNPKLIERARELRKNLTQAEKKIWFEFLNKHSDRFLRQRPIDNYIADFYCAAAKLIIEIDGGHHLSEDSIIYDTERTTFLEEIYGLKVLRLSNNVILYDFESVCKSINEMVLERKGVDKVDAGILEKDQQIIPPNLPFQGGNIEASEIPINPPYKGGQGGWKLEKDREQISHILSFQGGKSEASETHLNPSYKEGQHECQDSKFALGLHVPKFHSKIINVEECFLQSAISNDILNFTRTFFKRRNTSVYSTNTHCGFLRFLIIRQSNNTNDLMVNIITYDYNKDLIEEYSENLRTSIPGITTIINSISSSKAQVAKGEKENILFGSGFITEKLRTNSGKEYQYKISPGSFFQTNTLQAEKLFNTVVEFGEFNSSDYVLDLYCGAGSISIFISGSVNKVLGVEIVEDSITDAKRNVQVNNLENAEFVTSDIKVFLENDLSISGYNKLILDPPRSGLHPKICEILSETKFEKIIYVSCNPHTQARDLQIICGKGNYVIEKSQPVDMFPHTYHVENIVSLICHKMDR